MSNMETAAPALLPVKDREIAIINYLRRLEPDKAASVRDIWEKVSKQLDDSVTAQAYHKILDRLVAIGRVEQSGEETARGKLFRFAPHLHVTNPATLNDIYEWVTAALPPSEVIARAMNAMDYFEEKKQTTLKRAAEALLDEDPVELFYDMLLFHLRALQADLAIYNHKHPRPNTPNYAMRKSYSAY